MGREVICFILALVAGGFAASGSAAELAHRWSFNGDLRDSVGGQDAILVDEGDHDAVLSDTAVTLTGGTRSESDYIDLPDHILSDLGPTVTFELWATQISVQNWSRIYSFGSGTAEHTCMSWTQGTTLTSDHAEYFGPNDDSRLDNTNAPYELGVPYHIVVVFESGLMTWYTAPAGSAELGPAKGSFVISDVSDLDDINCWLGRSQYDDGTANASYDECRLWLGALSETEREKLHTKGPDGLRTGVASDPSPADEAVDVPSDSLLEWAAAKSGVTHDVYFGASWDDVNGASRSTPLDVLVSQGQVSTMYDPDCLTYGQTYWWRVDEVNAPPDSTIIKGDIWSFTVEPVAYAVADIVATSNAASEDNSGPEKTVDGSGLNADDQHSTLNTDMWVGTTGGAEPVWIQYEFDRAYKLSELWVWNYNLAFELMFGFGFKDVTIEYSQDGIDWTTLKDVQFAQATARNTYAANTVVDMEGVAARYVRLTANSGYGLMGQYGLSEVRFLYTQVQAREPEPSDGATEVGVEAALDWRAGREAAAHEVYLGTDAEALALVDTVTASEYNPGGLDLGATYYWQIVEVNAAEAVSRWEGDLWCFTTQDCLVIDDFEDYNDEDNLIYEAWEDGWINGTGSTVGYLEAPFAEQTVVHSGQQAMPLSYDSVGGGSVSEADLTFAAAQDWTQAGATTLTLYLYGDRDNDAGQVYVKINGTKVVAPADTTQALWKQWDIDLASTGANLRIVTSVTIGVEGSGSGLIYVDDLRLYRSAPDVVTPVDPGNEDLVAHYAFEDNFNDLTGNGYDGSSPWSLAYVDAPGTYGKAVSFDGVGDYLDLPIGTLLPTLTDSTFATLVNFSDDGDAWQRIFDFGSGSANSYMLLCPRSSNGRVWFAITTSGGSGESVITSPSALPTGWHHVAAVIEAAAMTVKLYVDGKLVGEGPTAALPSDLGVTTQNWLGRSQYDVDAYFDGALDDFRIYRRALSAAEVRYLAGDR